jgi:glycosyltransferase involved in cell wall biosynthesis
MKYLFTTTYYSPYISGLSLYVKRLAEGLAARNHDVTVWCMRHDNHLKKSEMIRNVKVARASTLVKLSKGFLSWEWIVGSIKMVRECDVVWINLPQVEGVWVAILAKLMKKKLGAIYHCEIQIRPVWVQLVVELSNLIIMKFADTIVTYTDDYARNSKLLKRNLAKVKCVYPPVPIPKNDKAEEERIRLQIGKTKFVIGVAARMAKEKGVEYLLGAIPLLKIDNYKIVIAGPTDPVGEEKYRKKIIAMIKKHQTRVVLLGSIDPEKMGAFYKNIDVLALPSIDATESFGMVQVEAMMMGVPVVSSDLPGVRVPIEVTGMGISVPIKDSRAIAGALVQVLNKKKELSKLSTKVEKIFNIENTLDFFEK